MPDGQYFYPMRKKYIFGCLLFLISLFPISINFASAQKTEHILLNPTGNSLKSLFSHEFNYFDKVSGKDGNLSFGLLENKVALKAAPLLGQDEELYLIGDFYWLSIDNDDNFPADNAKSPTDLYDLSFGAIYRRQISANWDIGTSFQFGTATPSGDLFDSSDEMYVSGIPFIRAKHSHDLYWILLRDLDTKRDKEILPGAGLQFQFGQSGWAALGFPFAHVNSKLSDSIFLEASYRPERNLDSKLFLNLSEEIIPYMGFNWSERYFMRAKRADNDHVLTFEDKRVFAGSKFIVTNNIALDLKAGRTFDREFGEGKNRSERRDNSIAIGDAWFGGIELTIRS